MLHSLLALIQTYLEKRCTQRDVERWLLANLQNILSSGSGTAIRLANEVDAGLVEFAEGIIDEEAFRSLLLGKLEQVETSMLEIRQSERLHSAVGTSVARTLIRWMEDLGEVADHRLALQIS